MKIERLNEKQIRCTLYKEDLADRSINLMELAYGSNSAKQLFSELLQQASFEVGFDVSDVPIMVEAIPISNESIVLLVTKVEEPEEVDTRFAKFAPLSENGQILNFSTPEALEGLEEFNTKNKDNEENTSAAIQYKVFIFNSLDEIIQVARIISFSFNCYNTLYKREKDGKFFLIMENNCSNPHDFANICNTLSEYGTKVSSNYSSKSFYSEHYTLIVRENALQKLSLI